MMRPPSTPVRPSRIGATQVSGLGFGCGRIGSFNNPASTAETRRLLERALELGITLFDTADVYGQGDSEREVGRLLKGRRDAAFVVSKVGQRFSTGMRLLRPLKPILKSLLTRSGRARGQMAAKRSERLATDFTPAYLRKAIDGSLRRLGFDRIDALLLHSPSASDLSDPAIVAALQHAQAEGKILHYGVACDDAACLDAALLLPGLSIVEIPPLVLEARFDKIRACAEARGLAVLAREVIRWRGELSPLMAVRAMVERAEVACTIVGTSSPDQLEQLVFSVRDGPWLERTLGTAHAIHPSIRAART